jgi:formimidoylglutamate deiminase
MHTSHTPDQLFAPHALLPTGWAQNVMLRWDPSGRLLQVQTQAQPEAGTPVAEGPVVPGLPNVHSHAFQRVFAGLTEYRTATQGQDSFWSWRTQMYRFALRISPAQLETIATCLYLEMLASGYTSVCEFHYLHHAEDGQPYADESTLAQCLLRAAKATGMGLTLLPVLYQSSGFGEQSPLAEQRRFIRSTDNMLRLLQTLKPICDAQGARLGLAPHSLRAVPPASLHAVLAGLDAIDESAPIHIHIAEQIAEVQACLAWSGQRPVQWLLANTEVNARWCLVHATHMDAQEYQSAAQSGAVTGLCPSTEANLGDGLFDLPQWLAAGGAWAIGSDSHVCVDAAEELMLLEYGQRLCTGQRNVLASPAHAHTATALWLAACAGGARASARAIAGLMPGQQADLVELDAQHPALAGLSAPDMLAGHLFASHRSSAVSRVWTAGQLRHSPTQGQDLRQAQAAFLHVRTALLQTP